MPACIGRRHSDSGMAAAATKIQALRRRYQVRQRVAWIKMKRREELEAARAARKLKAHIDVQRTARGWRGRRDARRS